MCSCVPSCRAHVGARSLGRSRWWQPANRWDPLRRETGASPAHTGCPNTVPTGTHSLSDFSMTNHPRGAWTFKDGVRKCWRLQPSRLVKKALASPDGFVDLTEPRNKDDTSQAWGRVECKYQPEGLQNTQSDSIMLLFLYHGKRSFYSEV